MSFATRCTSCGTIFRVVLDQLKVSEGWVRCGRCHAVFDAEQGLFDLEHDAPPAREEPAAPLAGQPDANDFEASPPAPEVGYQTPEDSTDSFAASPSAESAREGDDAPAAEPEGTLVERAQTDGTRFEPMADSAHAPGFVLQSDRDQRWQRTPVRLALGLLALLMLLGLIAQAAHHFRHQIAAQWPASQSILKRYCAVAGCRIDPLHRIESVRIENSALSAAERADAPDALKLVVTLQNRGSLPVAMPALDLSLTDTHGEVVSRRALLPTDFEGLAPLLQPGVETPLRLSLAVTGSKVSGYTVEVFYP